MTADLREQLQRSLGEAHVIERELGGGGMSRVFLAEEVRFRRRVVIKVLSPELAAAISVQRFEREITLAAQMQQANIVSVITAGDVDGLPYFTMPYVEGESLRARLSTGPLAIAETVSVLRDVARALAYAHERGIVHRDIKPDNVLLSGAAAVVTDFGIAKALADAAGEQALPESGTNLTQIGSSIGTPAYMAPEQAAGDPDVDHRADIYAFGCMAYEMLAGAPPFVARTPQRVLAAHLSETPRNVMELRTDSPTGLSELVMRCLAKDPHDRPQSAQEILRGLEDAGSVSTASSPAVIGNPGMWRRALLAYAGAFVLVAIVARAAIIALGLPDWVFPGALIVMALGLPVILFTAYAHHVTQRLAVRTPTLTPGGSLRTNVPQGTLATMAVNASPHLSWRRTWKGGLIAFGTFVMLVSGFMILRARGIGPFGSLLAAGKLHAREPLLLTDFTVVHSDSSLGSVISQAVRSDLEQSDAITLVPQATITQALQRMQRAAGTRVDVALARDIAAREGVKAIVDGEIVGVGNGFLVMLRLVTADSGRELAVFRESADGVKELINAVDVVTRKLRGRIGESLKDVRASPPLSQVTTASVDALRKYSAAVRATASLDYTRALDLSREAIALDTTFALAYRHLSEALSNLGVKNAEADSAIHRAFRMRDRLTDRERLMVEGDYYTRTGDREKAIAAYRALVDRGVYTETNSLAIELSSRRDFAGADSILRLRIRVDPDGALAYRNLALRLLAQGRYSSVDSVLGAAEHRFPSNHGFELVRADLVYAREGSGPARQYLASVARTRSEHTSALLIRANADIALLEGRVRDHGRLLREAAVVDSTARVPRDAVMDSIQSIASDAWLFGPTAEAEKRLGAALGRVQPGASPPYLLGATVYALLGRPVPARALLLRYDREVRDTTRRRIDLPELENARGELAIAEHRIPDAVTEFSKGDRLPDGPAVACVVCLYTRLARAYDAGDNADSTAAMIVRFMETPSDSRLALDAVFRAPFLKRLGELYEAKGDRAKAAASYQKFIDLWRHADPELQSKVHQVTQRLIHLRDLEGPARR